MGGTLHIFGRNPEALTTAGHSASTAQASTSRVLAVWVPQLWEDLVKFVHGKDVSFSITEGRRVQANLPASEQDTPSLPFTPENRARAKVASPLHDPDGCVGLEHPMALELLQFLISGFQKQAMAHSNPMQRRHHADDLASILMRAMTARAADATKVITLGELDLTSMPKWQPNVSRSFRLPMQSW